MAGRALGILYILCNLLLIQFHEVHIIVLISQMRKLRSVIGNRRCHHDGCWVRCQCFNQALTFMSCCNLGHMPYLPALPCSPVSHGHRDENEDFFIQKYWEKLWVNMCKAVIKVSIHIKWITSKSCHYPANQDWMKIIGDIFLKPILHLIDLSGHLELLTTSLSSSNC